jgi:hypothetical protein
MVTLCSTIGSVHGELGWLYRILVSADHNLYVTATLPGYNTDFQQNIRIAS